MFSTLALKHCVPCEGGVPPLTQSQATEYLALVPGWQLSDDGRTISREWKLSNFQDAMAFVNRVADCANAEEHHPDIQIFSYRRVRLALTTHAISGLSENDFILAAKIDALQERSGKQ